MCSRSTCWCIHALTTETGYLRRIRRFTPATHAMVAFHRALTEFRAEGGVEARAARYKENNRIVREVRLAPLSRVVVRIVVLHKGVRRQQKQL